MNEREDKLTSIPGHLLEPDWLAFEFKTAMSVIESIEHAIKPFEHNAKNKSIHNIRIAFRRWFSIWEVLREDGWESDSYGNKLGRKLKRFYKLLGRIRDWDVNTKLAAKEKLPLPVLEDWKNRRKKARKKAFEELAEFKLKGLIKKLKRYLKERHEKLRLEYIRYQGAREETVFSHLEKFLAQNETQTREISKELKVMEDIHNFRLKIKSWRYLLVEFYGVSNVLLVEAQKQMGYIVDYDRMRVILEESLTAAEAKNSPDPEEVSILKETIAFVVAKRNILIKELDQSKQNLPYGFRPLSATFE
ncbi:MAG: CHAD domain-containing protein [Cyanobacteriota/Melainabacteria group bacterium]